MRKRGEVTWSRAACTGVFTGEGEGKWLSSMVISRICDRGSNGGKVRGLETAHASTDSLDTGGGHTILGAAKAP